MTASFPGLRATLPSIPSTLISRRLVHSLVALLAFLMGMNAGHPLSAQTNRSLGFQADTTAIVNARLVPRPGEQIERGTLLIRNGMITALGADVTVPAGARKIDGTGLWVYAGFIDAAASDLIDGAHRPTKYVGQKVDFERHALAATRPDHHSGLTPDFHAATALKRESNRLSAAREAGFTAIHTMPTGRIASGQGTLVSTADGELRETVLSEATMSGLALYARGGNDYPSTLMGCIAHLRQKFVDARRHQTHLRLFAAGESDIQKPAHDPVLDEFIRLLDRELPVLIAAETADEIERATAFTSEHELTALFWGGDQAAEQLELLTDARRSLILRFDIGERPKVQVDDAKDELQAEIKAPRRVQQDKLDDWKRRAKLPARLHAAGLRFAVSSQGLKDRSRLLTAVRTAVENGWNPADALAALTTDAATLLKMEDRLGTLAPGRIAHAVVMTGPFEHGDAKVRHVLIGDQIYEYNTSAKPVSPEVKPTDGGVLDLAGRWSMKIESADGPLTATLELGQSGKSLRGQFESEQGDGRITSGTIDGTAVRFVVGIGAGARSVELKFEGQATADELKGTLKAAFGAATKWSARRQSSPATAAANPVHISLGDDSADDTQDTAGSDTDPQPPAQPVDAPGSIVAHAPAVWTLPADGLPTELKQDRINQAPRSGGNLLVRGGTVLTGTGQVLPETSVLIREGKIAAIGPDLEPDDGMTVLDATGRYVMPGIIDTHSHIMVSGGLNESTQSIVPEVRVRDVIRTDDLAEYRALAGGVTTARLLHGSANVIGGQDAVVKLKYGESIADHLLKDAPQGVKFALGENVKYRRQRFPDTRMGVEATLNRAFLEAVDYRRQWMLHARRDKNRKPGTSGLLAPRRDLRLEALADIVDHQKFIHAHCYRADEILMLLRVASNLGIRVWSLQHVLEGYKIAPEIAAHGASCSTFADWWAYKVEAFDAAPHNAALLQEAGVNVAIKSDDAELIRHMNLEAAKTVRYGNMSPAHALQAITLHPARELGLSDRIGSLEVGKDGDLAIFNGHPFNAFARCEVTVIEGQVRFSRTHAPSAMLAEAADSTAAPRPLELPSAEVRARAIDLSLSDDGRYAITGARLYPVDAEIIEKGTLIVEDGRITAIGEDVDVPTGVRVIDGAGLHVTPGLIDAGTTLGLVEIRKVVETHDYDEGGLLQPDLRAGVAVNPDSELFPVARAGGITMALIRPTGGVISGQASLIRLAGWTAPEMTENLEAGLQIIWPGGSSAKSRIKSMKELLELGRIYQAARDATKDDASTSGPIVDPRMEALLPYLKRERPVFIEADSRQRIAEALLFAEEEKLRIVITGGTDAWKLAEELKAREVPVIVGPVMQAPRESHDPFDAPYANAGRLHAAGVKFCIRSDNASNSRNAPFEAAMAVAWGLPEAEGLRSVTLSAAEILGIGEEVGSLTVGKRANIVIADGSPLQITSQIKGVFIDGVPYPPVSRQTRFYERYRRRLHEFQKNHPPAVDAGTLSQQKAAAEKKSEDAARRTGQGGD